MSPHVVRQGLGRSRAPLPTPLPCLVLRPFPGAGSMCRSSRLRVAGSLALASAVASAVVTRLLCACGVQGWLEFIGASVGAGGTVLAGIILLCDIMQLSRRECAGGRDAHAA